MATDVERLIVRLEATQSKFEKQLAAANRTANRRATSIERRFTQMNKRIGASLQGIGTALVAGISIRGAQRLIDASTRIENALKVAGLTGDELAGVYDRLFASAQKNVAPLEALVELYSRASLVQKELNVSTEDLLGFTDKVAVALRVSGKSAAESSGALLQLSQALGSGVVRAEEFNSILEGALPIAQAAAAGLDEAGGSVAKLRELVVDGKVSSEAFFRAFEAGSVILEQKVAGAELTVSQSFIRLQNVLIDVAGKFDEATGVSQSTARAIERVADIIGTLGEAMDAVSDSSFSRFIENLSQSVSWLDDMEESLGFVESRLAAIQAFAGVFSDVLSGRVTAGESSTPTDIGTITKPAAAPTINGVPVPTPGDAPNRPARRISLADYPVSGGKEKKTRENDLEREIRQIKERTAAITAETAALATLNPLIDDYGYAVARASAEAELLAAAQKAGLTITPELRDRISELADSYARAEAGAAQLGESQDKLRQRMEDMRDTGRDVMKGFISDLVEGKSASEALAGALGKVADKLIDVALNNVFSGSGGGIFGGGRGLLGGAIIPGILHKGGVAGRDGYGHGRSVSPSVFANAPRYHDGGIAGLRPGEVPAILQKGEPVLPKGTRIGGGSTVINQNFKFGTINGEEHLREIARQAASDGIQQAAPALTDAASSKAVGAILPGGRAARSMQAAYNLSPRGRKAG